MFSVKRGRSNDTGVALSLKPLIQNGYISKTLRTIQIGTKSVGEWVGEELLIMQDVNQDKFDYTAIAVTKLETYVVNYSDL